MSQTTTRQVESRTISGAAVRACLALTLTLVSSYIMNLSIFPRLDGVFPEAREISTFCGAGFFFILAFLAYKKPSLFNEKVWAIGSVLVIVVSLVGLYFGIVASRTEFLVFGSPIGGLGSAWFIIAVGIAMMKLPRWQCAVAISFAFVLKYVVALVYPLFQDMFLAAILLYLLCHILSYLLVRPAILQPLDTIRKVGAPTELDVTNPTSYLSLAHPLFVAIFLFNLACGFALTFQSVNSIPPQTALSFIPLLIVFAIVFFAKKRLSADLLFQACVLLVLAGFLLVPVYSIVPQSGDISIANIFLNSGADCFDLLILFLIAVISSRNELGVLPNIAFSKGASWIGIGIGAAFGHFINDTAYQNTEMSLTLFAIVVFIFVAYNFVSLKDFSFEATIEGVMPVAQEVVSNVADEDLQPHPSFEESCEAVISDYKLTNREGDVLRLLAKGRSSTVIQEKLVLSRNTIKTHVRNIYNKLEIHSQQELIDLVEQVGGHEPTQTTSIFLK